MTTLDTPTLDPALGPAAAATLLSKNYLSSIEAWCEQLHQHIHTEIVVSEAGSKSIGVPWLEGRRAAWLANELNEPWLRIIEVTEAEQREPFTHYGWLSLEISVEDVDELYKDLLDSPFKVIGEPANLEISDNIRAMQVVGLDGEVFYLTQVNAQVAPFEIASARCAVDKLFIPVATVPERAKARDFYTQFSGVKSYDFDTKITVINDALGFEHAHQHPVSIVQLAGQNMIELDQVSNLEPARTFNDDPMTGIIAISILAKELPSEHSHYVITQGPYIGLNACIVKGEGGEIIELIKSAA